MRPVLPRLDDIVERVRSKNAGPFWITIDIFCGSAPVFARVSRDLGTARIAELLHTDPALLQRFDIAELHVIKVSLPRPQVQGTRFDRDMHGAALGALVGELVLP